MIVTKSLIPPRAAIIYKGNFELLQIESLSNEDCVVCLWNSNNTSFLLASVYLDITKDTIPSWLTEVCEYANKKDLPLILGMDSNAHSVLFGTSSNKRGEELEDFILKYGLMVENVGTEPTWVARRSDSISESCIDVTLSRGVDNVIKQWNVCKEFNGSDHRTITFKIDTKEVAKEYLRSWKKANWTVFKSKLEKNERQLYVCLLYTSPSPRDLSTSRMPSSA